MVNSEDVSGTSPTPRDVERHLIVEQIPKEDLLLGTCVLDLSRRVGSSHVPSRERKNLARILATPF